MEHTDWAYHIHGERAAVKGQDGFKFDVYSDDESVAKSSATRMYSYCIDMVKVTEIPEPKKKE